MVGFDFQSQKNCMFLDACIWWSHTLYILYIYITKKIGISIQGGWIIQLAEKWTIVVVLLCRWSVTKDVLHISLCKTKLTWLWLLEVYNNNGLKIHQLYLMSPLVQPQKFYHTYTMTRLLFTKNSKNLKQH